MKPVKSFLMAMVCAASLAVPAVSFAATASISDTTTPSTTNNEATEQHHGHHHGMFSKLRTLNLTQQQQNQIKSLISAYRTAHPEGSQPDPAAKKKLHEQILGVLTPAQRTKLDAEMRAWRAQHGATPTPSPTH